MKVEKLQVFQADSGELQSRLIQMFSERAAETVLGRIMNQADCLGGAVNYDKATANTGDDILGWQVLIFKEDHLLVFIFITGTQMDSIHMLELINTQRSSGTEDP